MTITAPRTVDTGFPVTIEDLDARAPAAEHTGNLAQLIALRPLRGLDLANTSASSRQLDCISWQPIQRGLGWRPSVTDAAGEEVSWFISYLSSRLSDLGEADEAHGLRIPIDFHLQTPGVESEEADAVARQPDPLSEGGGLMRLIAAKLQSSKRPYGAAFGPTLQTDAVATELRKMVDMPVQDLAAMFGVRRRQFYNWMSGESMPSTEQEARLRRVHAAVSEFSSHLQGDREQVRAVLLTPVDGGPSIYDLARTGQDAELEAALEHLADVALEHLTPRLPPSGTYRREDPQWQEAERRAALHRRSEPASNGTSDRA